MKIKNKNKAEYGGWLMFSPYTTNQFLKKLKLKNFFKNYSKQFEDAKTYNN